MRGECERIIALGGEAVAYAAIDAGVKGVFGYPGTPSTEVLECAKKIIKKNDYDRIACWGPNEKVSYEMALGASYAGNRSLVTMKHVGLNVAMDPFVNSAITGIHGGLVCLVADDPGMHSSQNEQDSRYLSNFALIPCIEPSNLQEVYDYTLKAYDLSEELCSPVLLRLVTRLAHARGEICKKETAHASALGLPEDNPDEKWVLIPINARIQNRKLREKTEKINKKTDEFNSMQLKGRKGVVLSGMGRAYFDQICLKEPGLNDFSRLNVSAYPLNYDHMEKFLKRCNEIFIFEESYPFLEDQIILASHKKVKIHGRRDNTIPVTGELNLLSVRNALQLKLPEAKSRPLIDLPVRAPRLCKGCGHIDAYKAIQMAFKNIGVDDPRIFGDIGCNTLLTLPPYNSIQTCVEMGASLGMALGASVVGMNHAVGLIGDSTFYHSGMTSLVALKEVQSNVTFIILDNNITAMTGHQETIAVNIIEDMAKSAGLANEQIHILYPVPKQLHKNVAILETVLSHDGPDLVIFRRECIQAKRRGLYDDFCKNQFCTTCNGNQTKRMENG